ncbi:Protein tilB [Boothiomyces macroporosus]|uniref:Protein tilB n=1 Tax=Boothiomyces macroporosus TaxID=261099 RepID=A0AAD5Y7A0_9FUNG|nr:Protein tilB [Boothiomyces macroporosus]
MSKTIFTKTNSPNPGWQVGATQPSMPGSYKHLDPAAMEKPKIYKFLISAVVPRPIALVSTVNKETGTINVAPFSYFNVVCHDPPTLMVSINYQGGQPKDTLKNIMQNSEFVVNMMSECFVESANHASGNFPYEVSELDQSGLTILKSDKVVPPRIEQSAVSFECKVHTINYLKNTKGETTAGVVLGEIAMIHVKDSVLDEEGTVDIAKYNIVSRLGGVRYVDEALLRRRSEHNDGELTTLKEISLHQFDIEKIENLDKYCRNLEILYLQCNQIMKIENLNKLKSLKYLQLSLNNIRVVENLQGCESLEKLDLTVNFVEDLVCLENLKENDALRQLYLTGNPCTDIEGYRSFVIATLPQLQSLDGQEIKRSERIIANQQYKSIRDRLLKEKLEKGKITRDEIPEEEPLDADLEAKKEEFQNQLVGHSPEERLKAARELDKLRNKDKKHLEKKEPKKKILVGPDGRIYQKNEGKWTFNWQITDEWIKLTIDISKYLDTSLINVQVNPTFVCITIKEKILQLLFEHPVKPDSQYLERSKLTGQLAITVARQSFSGIVDLEKAGKEQLEIKPVKKELKPQKKRFEKLGVDYKNIVKEPKKIFEKPKFKPQDTDFVDDPDVPPLC